MYILRCTGPLLRRLQNDPRMVTTAGHCPSTTILGDWYATRLNIGRHRLVLCTNERSLLSVVVPAKNLPALPQRLSESVATLLTRIGVPPAAALAEIERMAEVRLDRTASRRVLGSMADFRIQADYYFRMSETAVHLGDLDFHLSKCLCGPLDYGRPIDRARELLAIKPSGGIPSNPNLASATIAPTKGF